MEAEVLAKGAGGERFQEGGPGGTRPWEAGPPDSGGRRDSRGESRPPPAWMIRRFWEPRRRPGRACGCDRGRAGRGGVGRARRGWVFEPALATRCRSGVAAYALSGPSLTPARGV